MPFWLNAKLKRVIHVHVILTLVVVKVHFAIRLNVNQWSK